VARQADKFGRSGDRRRQAEPERVLVASSSFIAAVALDKAVMARSVTAVKTLGSLNCAAPIRNDRQIVGCNPASS
jgi:hypothetical protein